MHVGRAQTKPREREGAHVAPDVSPREKYTIPKETVGGKWIQRKKKNIEERTKERRGETPAYPQRPTTVSNAHRLWEIRSFEDGLKGRKGGGVSHL